VNGAAVALVTSYLGCAVGTLLVALGVRRPPVRGCRHEPAYEDDELVRTPAVSDRFDHSIHWQLSVGRCVHCGEPIASVTCLTGDPQDPLLLSAWAAVDAGRPLE
jgi:hypothetical protein